MLAYDLNYCCKTLLVFALGESIRLSIGLPDFEFGILVIESENFLNLDLTC